MWLSLLVPFLAILCKVAVTGHFNQYIIMGSVIQNTNVTAIRVKYNYCLKQLEPLQSDAEMYVQSVLNTTVHDLDRYSSLA